MKITKLHAGILQLKEAINFFFERRDPIAVHTVAGAASNTLFNLSEYKGLDSPVRGNPNVREEKKGLWISKINEAQNFFKHADRDPDADFEFDPWITEILIFEGCFLVESLTGEMFPEAKLFTIWFSTKYPEFLSEGSYKELIKDRITKGLDVNDFKSILVALSQIRKDNIRYNMT